MSRMDLSQMKLFAIQYREAVARIGELPFDDLGLIYNPILELDALHDIILTTSWQLDAIEPLTSQQYILKEETFAILEVAMQEMADLRKQILEYQHLKLCN